MRLIFVDTSFFYAHAYARDSHHLEAVKFLEHLPAPLITTNFVFDELITILRYDFGHEIATKYGGYLRESNICTIARLLIKDEEAAWRFFLKYDDQDFSFTDCTSFAFMQRVGIREAAAFDAHFDAAGFVRLPAAAPGKRKR